MSLLRLKVVSTTAETPLIKRIVLASEDGAVLPGFDPGAHITVHMPGIGRRKYSLVNAVATAQATATPVTYTLGVRIDDGGQGGSKWMHALKVGDRVEAEPPGNDFELAAGTGPVTLLAGGIGVTPLISKAAALKAAGRPFRFIYAARHASEFAFLSDIRPLAGDRLTLHADEDAGTILDIKAIIDQLSHDEPVYICGPRPMIKAAMNEAKALGWAKERLRYELFFTVAGEVPAVAPAAPAVEAPVDDGSFEIELKSTGATYRVPADKSIVDVLVEAGADPLFDCNKGECGVCQCGVLEGVPDHRDSILSDSERAAGKIMQICVSRSKTPKLVLDL